MPKENYKKVNPYQVIIDMKLEADCLTQESVVKLMHEYARRTLILNGDTEKRGSKPFCLSKFWCHDWVDGDRCKRERPCKHKSEKWVT